MAIPKILIQTYKNNQLPFVARMMIKWIRYRNPKYQYEFYDDERIIQFLEANYESEIVNAYKKLTVGASMADFFRYLVLYKTGGVYMDLDAYLTRTLDSFIKEEDIAILAYERNEGIYAQYALVFAPGHPIMKYCIEIILDNISARRYLHDCHKLTGPTVYTAAVERYLKENPEDKNTRYLGVDYNGYIKPKYWLHAGLFSRREKWQTAQQQRPALRD